MKCMSVLYELQIENKATIAVAEEEEIAQQKPEKIRAFVETEFKRPCS